MPEQTTEIKQKNNIYAELKADMQKLPEKKKEPTQIQKILAYIRPEVESALEKGYIAQEIYNLIENKNITDVKLSTLKIFITQINKENKEKKRQEKKLENLNKNHSKNQE